MHTMRINLVAPKKFIGAHGKPVNLNLVVGYAAVMGALVNVPLLFLGAPLANVIATSAIDAVVVAGIAYFAYSTK
jgi:hypothetical protein